MSISMLDSLGQAEEIIELCRDKIEETEKEYEATKDALKKDIEERRKQEQEDLEPDEMLRKLEQD